MSLKTGLKPGPRLSPGRRINKVLDFLPVPFWVYFLSILASNIGLLPHASPAYDWITRHVLPVAIILMLIGTPLTEMVTMGPKALAAMAVATVTIFFAQVVSYLLLIRYLPADAWQSVGALMGTWIGGSANMVAVKEILQMPDSNLSVLVVVDTIMSYTWMALLLAFAKRAQKYDDALSTRQNLALRHPGESRDPGFQHQEKDWAPAFAGATKPIGIFGVLAIGFLVGEFCVALGKGAGDRWTILPVNGWTLLIASTMAILLALTPLRQIKKWGTGTIGTLLLYLVLITIGAKTTLGGARLQAPVFLVYGALTFLIHGILVLLLARAFRLPFFLLSTASQANIGGAVSAPVVAEAYRSGTAHIGVLMAVLGAVLGTYLGVGGGYLCRALAGWLR